MNDEDLDRWVNLEGDEPPAIRELMDAGREIPELTPEQIERMDSAFFPALARQRLAHHEDGNGLTATAWRSPTHILEQ